MLRYLTLSFQIRFYFAEEQVGLQTGAHRLLQEEPNLPQHQRDRPRPVNTCDPDQYIEQDSELQANTAFPILRNPCWPPSTATSSLVK